jgi:sugar-specific transcriptional regulator TrmB
MVIQLQTTSKKLYDTDYNLWVMETVDQLKNKNFDAIDLENLIEEVSDLSRRDKRKLESLLRRLFEHLLKLKYWESQITRNQGHWKGEIRTFRKQINNELKTSPSLKRYLIEILDKCYQDAREIVSDKSQLSINTFPETLIGTMEQVLDENWLP